MLDLADEGRLAYQAGAEAPVLHPAEGAADIEVHLAVAELLGGAPAARPPGSDPPS